MSDDLHPCRGHYCDWCKICRHGTCCGADKHEKPVE